MPKRRWYGSLYSKIAIGYVVLLALLLLVQTSLAVWMTGRVWGGTTRTPAQLADLVAQDLSVELAAHPSVDLGVYLKQKYGRGYRPFVVVLRTQEETFSNRPTMIPVNLGREARRAMIGFIYGDAIRETGRGSEPARIPFTWMSAKVANGWRLPSGPPRPAKPPPGELPPGKPPPGKPPPGKPPPGPRPLSRRRASGPRNSGTAVGRL